MLFDVQLTEHARADLRGIGDYISQNESPARAIHVLEQIVHIVESLSEFPARGAPLTDFVPTNASDYRSMNARPFRIIYQVTEETVVVYVIADGRRDLRSLLMRRLLQT